MSSGAAARRRRVTLPPALARSVDPSPPIWPSSSSCCDRFHLGCSCSLVFIGAKEAGSTQSYPSLPLSPSNAPPLDAAPRRARPSTVDAAPPPLLDAAPLPDADTPRRHAARRSRDGARPARPATGHGRRDGSTMARGCRVHDGEVDLRLGAAGEADPRQGGAGMTRTGRSRRGVYASGSHRRIEDGPRLAR
ncbi:hypothetical protein PVAP13_8KG082552 [Panicum virgatum]|uniref:Uncharacterized protein n=1 Tax=Panicum virgatum TaxID=38727 RepID=A0A8T0PJ35_PANVG|nr:hypothetical protein PVAP13_8KG082552 [Panicum virgatum]